MTWDRRAARRQSAVPAALYVLPCGSWAMSARCLRISCIRDRTSSIPVAGFIKASRSQRLAAADDVIDNSGDLSALHAQVEHLHAAYVEAARTHATSCAPGGLAES